MVTPEALKRWEARDAASRGRGESDTATAWGVDLRSVGGGGELRLCPNAQVMRLAAFDICPSLLADRNHLATNHGAARYHGRRAIEHIEAVGLLVMHFNLARPVTAAD